MKIDDVDDVGCLLLKDVVVYDHTIRYDQISRILWPVLNILEIR